MKPLSSPETLFPIGILLMMTAAILMVLLFPSRLVSAIDQGPAERFIARFGEDWTNHFAGAYQSAYPFGRSNQNYDKKINQAATLDQASSQRTLTNKKYLFDGDWYAVEWIYGATAVKTGRRQSRSTLAFGRVKDDKLVVWEEYFDDQAGDLRVADQLPLYQPEEEPFPWPAGATIRHPYRP